MAGEGGGRDGGWRPAAPSWSRRSPRVRQGRTTEPTEPVKSYSLTTTFTSTSTEASLTITNVYAPSDHSESAAFLAELLDLLPGIHGPWLLLGDFNLIRDPSDKNTGRVDTRLCSMFNDAVDELGLLELPLLDSLYTWSNKRATPTLARLDRAFVNNDHSLAFPSTHLTSLVRQTSDHKPLLVSMSTNIPKSQVFRFENAWLKNAQFLPEVLPAWHGNGF